LPISGLTHDHLLSCTQLQQPTQWQVQPKRSSEQNLVFSCR